MACQQCDNLWRAYENSVFEHVRLCSKLKLALASNVDDTSCENLADEVSQAERKRAGHRSALLQHESAAGHGAASLSAKPAV